MVHLRWWGSDARLLVRHAYRGFSADHGPQLAASISYYVLFSIFPLAILAVSIAGLLLTNDRLRADVVDHLFDRLPLSEGEGRADLQTAVDAVASGFSLLGLLSLPALLWSASGMMAALRYALNQAWGSDFHRPFLRGKGVDLLMLLGVGVLMAVSFGATLLLQVVRRVSADVSEALGPLGEGATVVVEIVALLAPLAITCVSFMLVFKLVPDVKTRFRYVWPGALTAAVLFEILKNGFALYLRYFGSYDLVYGSLGAVVAFLFFVWLSSNVLLLGAEMAAEWPRVSHGHYDAGGARGAPRDWSWRALRRGLAALVRSGGEMPPHMTDTSGRARRDRRKAQEIARAAAPPADAQASSPASSRDEAPR